MGFEDLYILEINIFIYFIGHGNLICKWIHIQLFFIKSLSWTGLPLKLMPEILKSHFLLKFNNLISLVKLNPT